MSGQDLFRYRNEIIRELSVTRQEKQDYGIKLAKAEQAYYEEKAKTVLKLKDEGRSATEISMVNKGMKNVADKKLDRDVAETMRESCHDKINIDKLILRSVEAQIEREWGQAKREV